MRIRYGLICTIILLYMAAGVGYAHTDVNGMLASWQENWMRQGVVDVTLPEEHNLTSEQLLVNLAQLGSYGFVTGTNPMGFAFGYQALYQLLDGRTLDSVLVDALASPDASVRTQAARALRVFFERTRLICAPDNPLPAGCSAVGVYYTGNRIAYLINQLQHELGPYQNWNSMEFLRISRNVRSVIENTSIQSKDLVAILVRQLLVENNDDVKQGLVDALGSYLAMSGIEGVKVVTANFQANLSKANNITASLVLATANLSLEDTVKAQAWTTIIDNLELKPGLPALGLLIGHPNFNVAWKAAEAAAWLAGKGRLVTEWTSALQSGDAVVRWAGAQILALLGGELPPAVVRQVGDVQMLAPVFIPALIGMLTDNNERVKQAALEALEAWLGTGVTYPNEPFAVIVRDNTASEVVRAIAARILTKLDSAMLTTIPEAALLQTLHAKVAIYKSKTEGYNTFRIPAIIRSPQGTLLAFAEGRRNSASDTGDIDVVLKRSTDQGQTWSKLQVIWSDGTNTSGNPTPVVDEATGRIWLFMAHNNGQDTEAEISAGTSLDIRTIWSCYSDDDGITWSEPRNMFKEVQNSDTRGDTMGPGIGIQLRHGPHKGRLVLPALGRIIYSDDHGQTWHQGGRSTASNESQVVELSSGLLMRNDRPASWSSGAAVGSRRVLTLSTDQGTTWGAPHYQAELITPYVQGSIVRYVPADSPAPQSRVLLFSNPASETLRRNMSVWVSSDDGTTWPIVKQVHAGPAAYSCLVPLQDGTIGLLFEGGKEWAYENIYWTRFSMNWLMEQTQEFEPSQQ